MAQPTAPHSPQGYYAPGPWHMRAMGDMGSGCSRDDAVLLSRLQDHLPLRSQVIRLRQAWLGRAGPYDESALRRSQLFGAANFERTLRARRDSKGRVRRKESRAPVGRMNPGRARITPADRSLPERRSPTHCFGNTGSTTGRCNGGRVVGGRGVGVRKRGGSRVTRFREPDGGMLRAPYMLCIGMGRDANVSRTGPPEAPAFPVPPDALGRGFLFSFDRLSFNRSPVDRPRGAPAAAKQRSFLHRLEISQIGRRLVLLGGHQLAVGAEHVGLRADLEMIVVLRAADLAPIGPRI
jgi:hypothetical protein